MNVKRFFKPAATHTLVLLLAACGSMATLSSDQCTAGSDGLDDSDLFESVAPITAQATKPPGPDVMTKTLLVEMVKERTGLTQQQAEIAVSATFDSMVDAVKGNTYNSVQMPGLGTLSKKVRAARDYKTPKTGVIVHRPPTTYMSWKTASTLKGNLPQPPATP